LKKYQTIDEVEKTKAKAVAFAENVLQDDEKASDLEAESPESYAERKRIQITDNPQRRRIAVANGNGGSLTKADLADIVDQVTQILQDAYAPESSREELASAVGDALDILGGDGDDDSDDGSDNDSDDDGGSV
jgi:hypothetical protein